MFCFCSFCQFIAFSLRFRSLTPCTSHFYLAPLSAISRILQIPVLFACFYFIFYFFTWAFLRVSRVFCLVYWAQLPALPFHGPGLFHSVAFFLGGGTSTLCPVALFLHSPLRCDARAMHASPFAAAAGHLLGTAERTVALAAQAFCFFSVRCGNGGWSSSKTSKVEPGSACQSSKTRMPPVGL